MDHTMKDVTVQQFWTTLDRAAERLSDPDFKHDVQPPEIREPLTLWFRMMSDHARWGDWKSLLGRPVVAVWNAALAVLDEE